MNAANFLYILALVFGGLAFAFLYVGFRIARKLKDQEAARTEESSNKTLASIMGKSATATANAAAAAAATAAAATAAAEAVLVEVKLIEGLNQAMERGGYGATTLTKYSVKTRLEDDTLTGDLFDSPNHLHGAHPN